MSHRDPETVTASGLHSVCAAELLCGDSGHSSSGRGPSLDCDDLLSAF